MNSFEGLFAKITKRESNTVRKIALCGWDFAKLANLCFAEENEGLWNRQNVKNVRIVHSTS